MMRLSWIVPVAAMAATGACTVISPTETKTYGNSGFDSISASSGVDIVLKQGPFAVSATAPSDRIDRIVIEQEGSLLKISQKPDMRWFSWSEREIVTVAAPVWVSITATGGADIDVEGGVTGKDLSITTSGGADIKAADFSLNSLTLKASGGADVDAKNFTLVSLTATTGGGADLNISGTCKTAEIEASGGGDVEGGDFKCETATVSARSGGDVSLTVSGTAAGKASGGGDIRFHGNPAVVQRDETSGGDVTAD